MVDSSDQAGRAITSEMTPYTESARGCSGRRTRSAKGGNAQTRREPLTVKCDVGLLARSSAMGHAAEFRVEPAFTHHESDLPPTVRRTRRFARFEQPRGQDPSRARRSWRLNGGLLNAQLCRACVKLSRRPAASNATSAVREGTLASEWRWGICTLTKNDMADP